MPHTISKKTSVRKYINEFCSRLNRIEASKVSDLEYTRKYLDHLLKNKKYFISIYASVLDTLLEHSSQPASAISLIDFGAGNGLLGIFAKYCGFKHVYINDQDPDFLASAEKIAAQLTVVIDDFLPGDILQSKEHLASRKIDAKVGTDVIEHVYSIDDLFSVLQKINPNIISVFTTASYPHNYFRIKKIIRIQLKDELEGGTPDDSLLFGPRAMPPYVKIREDIIRENYPSFRKEEVKKLAILTRGLIKKDVLVAAEKYHSYTILPQTPDHPTNTCNPIDGSWSERILSLKEYEAVYEKHGFLLYMKNGFYNEYQKGIKGQAIYLANRIISYFPYFGKYFSPFILLIGSSNDK